jgi:hypothetical protein
MKEKFKKVGKFVFKFISWIIVAVIFFGIGVATSPTEIVEKEKIVIKEIPVEKIVNKEVEKIVNKEVEKIVEPEDYKKLKNNLPLCIEALQISSNVNFIAGDIFGNLDYYLLNPSALDVKTAEIVAGTKRIETLNSKIIK